MSVIGYLCRNGQQPNLPTGLQFQIGIDLNILSQRLGAGQSFKTCDQEMARTALGAPAENQRKQLDGTTSTFYVVAKFKPLSCSNYSGKELSGREVQFFWF